MSNSRNSSPFSVTHTYCPCMGVEPLPSKADSATIAANNIQRVLDQMHKALAKVAKQMVVQADSSCSEAPLYNIGDEVWLDTSHV
ncbi:hypothetical protein EDD16DRAFT_1475697 [Pisolithus croceorrhizus]|nr:hypothetical protein F5141DRAFT_1013120 [Pisolithus sp. B1]KAI6107030.1 hypothetical protein EV401DRAFT_1872022 [Pisolithus croceorrhizus]KAI6124034.1 hypothetical protein EDD16DRAFT_1475697 [Pisolithus croceorrhizus]KAI6150219.1 hypothetical protein EDD17DRAFT_1491882 [Pisolithus thermaeus]